MHTFQKEIKAQTENSRHCLKLNNSLVPNAPIRLIVLMDAGFEKLASRQACQAWSAFICA